MRGSTSPVCTETSFTFFSSILPVPPFSRHHFVHLLTTLCLDNPQHHCLSQYIPTPAHQGEPWKMKSESCSAVSDSLRPHGLSS